MTSLEEFHYRDRCAIVGIGETDYSRNFGRCDLTLATQAALAAIDDAGLQPDDIDGIVRCDMDTVYHHDLVESIGLQNVTYWSEVGPGGVAPPAMIGQAVGAILSGQANNVLVFRELNGRSGATLWPVFSDVSRRRWSRELRRAGHALWPAHTRPGLRDLRSAEHGRVRYDPRTARAHSRRVPEASERQPACTDARKPMTIDDYLEARMISTPLRLFDFMARTRTNDSALHALDGFQTADHDTLHGLQRTPWTLAAGLQPP